MPSYEFLLRFHKECMFHIPEGQPTKNKSTVAATEFRKAMRNEEP